MPADFLSRFTPSVMSADALETLLVQHQELVQGLVDAIRQSALTSTPYHMLLVAPPGMGKTHLSALVYHRLRAMPTLSPHLLIAWMREESWEAVAFPEVLLRILHVLHTTYDTGEISGQLENLASQVPDQAAPASAEALQGYVGKRTLLVLLENVDTLLAGLGKEGQQQLYAYLQTQPCILLATSRCATAEMALRSDSPFHALFHEITVPALSFDAAQQLVTQLASSQDNADLVSALNTPLGRGRLRAVHHLVGGNPWLYVCFTQLLTQSSLTDVAELLTPRLQALRPYYQGRLDRLSEPQRQLLTFLCAHAQAVAVPDIAQHCGVTPQTIMTQLHTLQHAVEARTVGSEAYGVLRDPLLRFCLDVDPQPGIAQQPLVDFLRLWYPLEALQQRLEALPAEAESEWAYVSQALRLGQDDGRDPWVSGCLQDYRVYVRRSDLNRVLQVAEELIALRGDAWEWNVQGYCFARLHRWQDALEACTKALERDPSDAWTWRNRSVALGHLGQWHEALTACNRATHLAPKSVVAWNNRSWILGHLGQWQETLVACNRVIELDPDNLVAWVNRGAALGNLGRWQAALAACNKVLELRPNHGVARRHQSHALKHLGRYEEALAACNAAMAFGGRSARLFCIRAETLLALHNWDEGIIALDEALNRFGSQAAVLADTTEAIMRNLFTRRPDVMLWRSRISALITLYTKHHLLAMLGQGLLRSIGMLHSPLVSDTAARIWGEEWQTQARPHYALQLPARLLAVALRYREAQDRRILLELPSEERLVLQPLLERKRDTTSVSLSAQRLPWRPLPAP